MKNAYEVRGYVTAIFLSYKGKKYESLIDTADLQKAQSYPNTWFMHYQPDIDNYYVNGRVIRGGVTHHLKLHRSLMDTPDNMVVDHINHRTLDNRRANLRNVTGAQNRQNMVTRRGSRCVKWNKGISKWEVSLVADKQRYSFGVYDNYEEALKTSKRAIAKFHPFSLEAMQQEITDIQPSKRERARKVSNVPGVTWHEYSKKWRVRTKVNGKMTIIGSYESLDIAIQCINEYKSEALAN